ncbi:hypothetical protein [Teredinibacter haidensis]|uniref:hypothetical protein n=1 Tax=Teredinibacter haidensis TaxID=2731755 RepID=UPI000948D56E|nr:hypothetical protein [Teredinibacter haidensis]
MKIFLLLTVVLLVLGCDGDDNFPDTLRSSSNIKTENISLYVGVEVHEPTEDEAEGHTHLNVEFYGIDRDGYFYSIELAEADALSISVDGMTTSIVGVPVISEDEKFFMDYSEELGVTAPGTEVVVTLNRGSTAALHTANVILPEETPFTLMPEDDVLLLTDELVVEWDEDENKDYGLRFYYWCDVVNNHPVNYSIRYPNQNVTLVSSPFYFLPDDYFNVPEDLEILGCELTARLLVYTKQEAQPTSDFEQVTVQTMRSQSIIRELNPQAAP